MSCSFLYSTLHQWNSKKICVEAEVFEVVLHLQKRMQLCAFIVNELCNLIIHCYNISTASWILTIYLTKNITISLLRSRGNTTVKSFCNHIKNDERHLHHNHRSYYPSSHRPSNYGNEDSHCLCIGLGWRNLFLTLGLDNMQHYLFRKENVS